MMTGGVEGGAAESVAHCVLSGCSTNLLTIIFSVCFITSHCQKIASPSFFTLRRCSSRHCCHLGERSIKHTEAHKELCFVSL